MPKENHTSLINADHKLVFALINVTHTLLGRDAILARALIKAQPRALTPLQLIAALNLPITTSTYCSAERRVVYKHIKQLRNRFPGLIYTLHAGRGWRISSNHNPRIVFDSHGA